MTDIPYHLRPKVPYSHMPKDTAGFIKAMAPYFYELARAKLVDAGPHVVPYPLGVSTTFTFERTIPEIQLTIEKLVCSEGIMFRATLTMNGEFIWSGLFDHHPNNNEVIDRWRLDDKKSPTFDKLEVVKE